MQINNLSKTNIDISGSSFLIKSTAKTHGFSYCGIAEAIELKAESGFLESWLKNAYHSRLSYMERNIAKRTNPRLLLEEAKSIIVLAMNYYPGEIFQQFTKYRIARYALGNDYHLVLKEKSEKMINEIQKEYSANFFSTFIDSAPIMEKAWAVRSGLGSIGKNGLLIIPGAGSYFSLCVIITDMPLEYDKPFAKDLCGNCNKCMDSCPVSAIAAPGVVDAGKCISALTIESKSHQDETFKYSLYNWIFGCDICQEVCPLNKLSKPSTEKAFTPYTFFKEITDEQWENMTENEFKSLFSKSPLKRMTYKGIMRNIQMNK